jgi:AcrR family transcriptional regulator
LTGHVNDCLLGLVLNQAVTMPARPVPRPRDANATREQILRAARRQFTELGYDQAGVRQIAAEAGVTAALINRYFGSKEGLFIEVLAGAFQLAGALPAARADFGAALTRYLAQHERQPPADGFDPLLLILRSISNPDALTLLRDRLDRRTLEPLARWLGGRDAEIRSGLVVATLMGLAILRKVLQSRVFKPGEEHRAMARLAPLLQGLADQR